MPDNNKLIERIMQEIQPGAVVLVGDKQRAVYFAADVHSALRKILGNGQTV